MEIVDGWSTEYQHRKFSVALNETDFSGLLADLGLDPGLHVRADVKFRILRQHAAFLVLGELADYLRHHTGDGADDPAPYVREQEAALDERNKLLREVWEKASSA